MNIRWSPRIFGVAGFCCRVGPYASCVVDLGFRSGSRASNMLKVESKGSRFPGKVLQVRKRGGSNHSNKSPGSPCTSHPQSGVQVVIGKTFTTCLLGRICIYKCVYITMTMNQLVLAFALLLSSLLLLLVGLLLLLLLLRLRVFYY